MKKELGNKIFGKFYFGMSRNQYKRELQNVKKQLGGIIKIAGYDFHIGYPAFVDNKLYKMICLSDDIEKINFEKEKQFLKKCLDKALPEKSLFEL